MKILTTTLVSLLLSIPGLSFAEAPWTNIFKNENDICFKYGTLSKECLIAAGWPGAIGKIECVAKKNGSIIYEYLLRWYRGSDGNMYVTLGETELTLPVKNPNAPTIAWVRNRFSGELDESNVQSSSQGHYALTSENKLTDIPEVVVGLPKIGVLNIYANDKNEPVRAEIFGINFDCIATGR